MDAENSAFKQAEIKRMEIPPKPEKHVPTMAEKRAEAEAMLGRRLTDEEARKLAGVHFNPPKTAAGAVPKPPKIRTAVQKVLDLISTADVNNPAHRSKLQQWLANPLSPEVAAAAAAKLTVPGTGGAMRR